MNDNLNNDLLCAIFKFKKATSQVSNDSEVRMNEVLALAIIDSQREEAEKSLVALEVGETLCISHSAVSQMFTSLEKKGYVQRSINESDKRQYRFTLTDKGREIKQQMKEEADKAIEKIISRFGQDKIVTLVQMLNDFSELLAQIQSENE